MCGAPGMEAWRVRGTEVTAAAHHARRMSAVVSDMSGAAKTSAAAPAMATPAPMAAALLGDRLAGKQYRAAGNRQRREGAAKRKCKERAADPGAKHGRPPAQVEVGLVTN
jgi:hypothetical protein